MHSRTVSPVTERQVALTPGYDLVDQLEDAVALEAAPVATLTGTGRVADVELAVDDHRVTFDEPLAFTLTGHVDETHRHLHVVLSRPSGQALHGALRHATVEHADVFVGWYDAEPSERHDPVSDLDRWQ